MSKNRLHYPDLSLGGNALTGRELHHAVASLRLEAGAKVILFDGAGREGVGRVVRINRRELVVEVADIEQYPFDVPRRVTIAVAMPKAHRQGYLVEKCTELGVAAIWPITTERSVTKPRAAAVERWSQRAVEAAKQAGRRWIPTIEAPMTFAAAAERVGEFDAAALTDAASPSGSLTGFLSGLPASGPVLVWVGPEGGWTDAERDRVRSAGVKAVRLGPTVLRTETAAVAVCALATGG
jgi:16S rRNA (uracil1498-N3)-methyltransferase